MIMRNSESKNRVFAAAEMATVVDVVGVALSDTGARRGAVGEEGKGNSDSFWTSLSVELELFSGSVSPMVAGGDASCWTGNRCNFNARIHVGNDALGTSLFSNSTILSSNVTALCGTEWRVSRGRGEAHHARARNRGGRTFMSWLAFRLSRWSDNCSINNEIASSAG
jgi:hypothetical protein